MPFRAESSFAGKAYSARKPFPFHVCTRKADGSGNKRPTEKSIQQKKKQHTDSRKLPVRMLFWFSIGGRFFETQWKRQAVNCAPSKKSIRFFDHLPISALVRLNCFCLHSLFSCLKFWNIMYHKWFDNIHLAGVLLISAALWFHFCITCHCHYCKWHPKILLQVLYL